MHSGKPVVLVLNRCDCWPDDQQKALLASIRRRLPNATPQLKLLAVAAAPRERQVWRFEVEIDSYARKQLANSLLLPLHA